MSDFTEQDKFDLMVDHIKRDHPWVGDPVSTDNVTLTYAEHPAIHEFESAKSKYNAVRHTIRIADHVGTPDPED